MMNTTINRVTIYIAAFAAFCLITTAAFADGATAPQQKPAGLGWQMAGRCGPGPQHGRRGMMRGRHGVGRMQRGPGRLFAQLDENGDGELTKQEFVKAWKRLLQADENKDGILTVEELHKHAAEGMGRRRGQRPRFGRMFQRFDKNNDGKLTENEVPPQAWVRLSQADENNDGAVTQDELRTNRPRGQRGRGGHRGQGRMMGGGHGHRPHGPHGRGGRGQGPHGPGGRQ